MIETNFKHTEIGLIPHDWEVKTLDEYAYIFNGDRSDRYPKDSEISRSGIPFVNAGHIVNGRLDFSNMDYISIEKYNSMSGVKFMVNDLLVCLRGSLGKNAKIDFEGGTVASSLCVIRPYAINPNYLSSIFNSSFFDSFIKEENNGSSQPNLSAQSLLGFKCPFPPTLAEQERIAGALSSIDTLMGALNEQIEKKRHIKQGTMQQLLTGKKRLKGFTGEWVEVRLGDVADIRTGKRNGDENVANGIYPFFVRSQTVHRINSYSYEGEAILIPGEGGIGSIFHYINGKFDYHQRVYKISDFADGINAKYVYFYMKYSFGAYAMQNTVKATVDSLRLPIFQEFKISLPPTITEQSAIAAVLSGMDTEIAALEQKRDKYIAIKQGMMQQLLTGRIRLLEEETQEKPIVQTIQPLQKQRTANVFFRRSVLAAEIADRLCEKRRFGHVKMEKLIFMTEKMCGIDLASHYHRDAAGPYDNRALRSIDSQLKKQKWFEAKSITDENGNRRYTYMPLANRGGHKQYFDLYYADVLPEFDNVINTMADWDTEHCEIIATLYSAWEDLLHSGNAFTDDDILNELYHRWHDSKKRFSAPRLLSALTWMRQNNFIPKK